MAPEIYFPTHKHGKAADWFSVGVTLHEFVTGRRPFETAKLQAFRHDANVHTSDLSLAFLESCGYLSEACKVRG
jgi:serine/threonine protein kinase